MSLVWGPPHGPLLLPEQKAEQGCRPPQPLPHHLLTDAGLAAPGRRRRLTMPSMATPRSCTSSFSTRSTPFARYAPGRKLGLYSIGSSPCLWVMRVGEGAGKKGGGEEEKGGLRLRMAQELCTTTTACTGTAAAAAWVAATPTHTAPSGLCLRPPPSCLPVPAARAPACALNMPLPTPACSRAAACATAAACTTPSSTSC